MHIPILIERVNGNGYRSRGGEQFALSAEGATREEVLAALQSQLQERLNGGAEVASLEVTSGPHPLARFAGTVQFLGRLPILSFTEPAIERYEDWSNPT